MIAITARVAPMRHRGRRPATIVAASVRWCPPRRQVGRATGEDCHCGADSISTATLLPCTVTAANDRLGEEAAEEAERGGCASGSSVDDGQPIEHLEGEKWPRAAEGGGAAPHPRSGWVPVATFTAWASWRVLDVATALLPPNGGNGGTEAVRWEAAIPRFEQCSQADLPTVHFTSLHEYRSFEEEDQHNRRAGRPTLTVLYHRSAFNPSQFASIVLATSSTGGVSPTGGYLLSPSPVAFLDCPTQSFAFRLIDLDVLFGVPAESFVPLTELYRSAVHLLAASDGVGVETNAEASDVVSADRWGLRNTAQTDEPDEWSPHGSPTLLQRATGINLTAATRVVAGMAFAAARDGGHAVSLVEGLHPRYGRLTKACVAADNQLVAARATAQSGGCIGAWAPEHAPVVSTFLRLCAGVSGTVTDTIS